MTVLTGPLLIPDPEALREPVKRRVRVLRVLSTRDQEVDAVVDAVLAVITAHGVPATAEHLERVDLGAADASRWSQQHRFVTDWQLP